MLHSVTFPIWPLEPFDERWSAPRRGLWAERAVARHLWTTGWRICAHRWAPAGTHTDIDLIAANDEMLLFAEIKCRGLGDADPWAEVYAPERVDRLRAAVSEYLRTTHQLYVNFTIDGYLVLPGPDARQPTIERRLGYIPCRTISGWQGC